MKNRNYKKPKKIRVKSELDLCLEILKKYQSPFHFSISQVDIFIRYKFNDARDHSEEYLKKYKLDEYNRKKYLIAWNFDDDVIKNPHPATIIVYPGENSFYGPIYICADDCYRPYPWLKVILSTFVFDDSKFIIKNFNESAFEKEDYLKLLEILKYFKLQNI